VNIRSARDLQIDGFMAEIAKRVRNGSPTRAEEAAFRQIMRLVSDAWGDLNGLLRAHSRFSYIALAGGRVRDGRDLIENPQEYFDHAEFFRWPKTPYRAAAIVAHLYDTTPAKAADYATEVGLQTHVPPIPRASWYYPGRTILVCYTRPGSVPIQWLEPQTNPEALWLQPPEGDA
jgi:hypothetical protein